MKHCKDCIRWYHTDANQCEVPSCGIFRNEHFESAVGKNEPYDEKGVEFIKSNLKFVTSCGDNKVYGHPTELNKNNDCYFHKSLPKGLRFLTRFARIIFS